VDTPECRVGRLFAKIAPDVVGKQVGHYRVIELLGEGGMGQVYLAEHQDLRRRVALKVLRGAMAGEPALVARFLNEARAASAVQHPAFVTVYDWGRTDDGAPYFVMELLNGQSLDRRLAAGPLPLEEALRIGEEVAAALTMAHALSIVHRDLKPANLFLVSDTTLTGGSMVKVLDFGIAKLTEELAAEGTQTRTGQLLGTPTYMSPEQCLGRKDVDYRADIYALGAVLFEMVCGQPPFVSQGLGELINMHVNAVPPRPSLLRPGIPSQLDAIVARTLAKSPDDRPQSMAELGQALADIRGRLRRGAAETVAKDSAFVEEATQKTAPASPLGARKLKSPPVTPAPTGGQPSTATVPPVSVTRHPATRGTESNRAVPRRGWAAILIVGGLAAGIVFAKVGRHRQRSEDAQSASGPGTPPAPDQGNRAPIREPAATKTSVGVRLDTTPPGAWVRSVPGDEDLGSTPLLLERGRGESLVVKVGLSGFRVAERIVHFDSEAAQHITLQPERPKRRNESSGEARRPPPMKL